MYKDFIFFALLVDLIGATSEPFYLSEILSGTFTDRKWNGTWISDSVFWYKDEVYNVRLFDASTNTSKFFLSANVYNTFADSSIIFSNDMNYVLIKHNPKPLKIAQYTVYDVLNKEYHHVDDHQNLQLVKWVPKSTGLVYVRENNLYYVSDITKLSTPRQLTRDGVPGLVYNGVLNYIYKTSTLWFSPDGDRLAFAHFDDTNVSNLHYVTYGDSDNQYPTVTTIKYPKVGTANPKVVLKFTDLTSVNDAVIIENIVDTEIVTEDYIYKDAVWANNNNIVGIFLNRVQNTTAAVRCNVDTLNCATIYAVNATNGWITLSSPIFHSDGSMFLIIAPEEEENDSYNHLSLIYNGNFIERRRLTYGKKTVTSVYKWDESKSIMWYVLIRVITVPNYLLIRYYLGSANDEYGTQHVFELNLNKNTDSCLTCKIVTLEGPCRFGSADFSLSSSYVALACNGPGPTVVQIQNLENLTYTKWETNEHVRKNLLQKLMPVQKNLEVEVEKNCTVHVRLFMPPELDENTDAKYPLIVYVYGGPNSHLISDEYSTSLENYFVTNRKYVYAFIDGRGSDKQGNKFMFQVYRRLGTIEVEDQIKVTKYLVNRYRFIDGTKIGIWGGSYGGFVTLMVLVKDTENVFKCGLAVAPVTNFMCFSSIYTERYMRLNMEQDNAEGYRNTDISKYTENLRDKLFCIIHGNADTNVHYQHSMMLTKALQKKDIIFCQQNYPDEDHNFANALSHLYYTIDKFFERCFKKE